MMVMPKKITAKIDSAMPTNTSLKASLVAYGNGTAASPVVLTVADADLLTTIDANAATSSSLITYLFEAVAGSNYETITRTVTFTLTDNV